MKLVSHRKEELGNPRLLTRAISLATLCIPSLYSIMPLLFTTQNDTGKTQTTNIPTQFKLSPSNPEEGSKTENRFDIKNNRFSPA